MTVTSAMAPSTEIRETVLEFCRRMLAGEADAANDLISRDPGLIFIGSAGEWVDDQEALRAGRLDPGEGLQPGSDPKAYAIGDAGWDPTYGARPLKRAIQRLLENPLALRLLEGDFGEGDAVRVDAKDGELFFERAPAREPAAA